MSVTVVFGVTALRTTADFNRTARAAPRIVLVSWRVIARFCFWFILRIFRGVFRLCKVFRVFNVEGVVVEIFSDIRYTTQERLVESKVKLKVVKEVVKDL